MATVRLLGTTAGLIVWASAFLVLYVGQALGCAADLHLSRIAGANALSTGLAVAWLLHLGIAGVVAWRELRRHRRRADDPEGRFLDRLAVMVAASSVAAIFLTGLPVLMTPPCT